MIPVIVDTREQKPWAFPAAEFTVIRRGLAAGDYMPSGLYTLSGLEQSFVIERKSLGDFVSTVIHDWIRFRKELYRLAGFNHAVIAVECDLQDILKNRFEGHANPQSIIARANECLIDHGIPVLFWGSAVYAEQMAARLLRMAWRRYYREENPLKDPPL